MENDFILFVFKDQAQALLKWHSCLGTSELPIARTCSSNDGQAKREVLSRSLQQSRRTELSILLPAFGMKILREKCKQEAGHPNE